MKFGLKLLKVPTEIWKYLYSPGLISGIRDFFESRDFYPRDFDLRDSEVFESRNFYPWNFLKIRGFFIAGIGIFFDGLDTPTNSQLCPVGVENLIDKDLFRMVHYLSFVKSRNQGLSSWIISKIRNCYVEK